LAYRMVRDVLEKMMIYRKDAGDAKEAQEIDT
jgi:hypothetical protein